MARAIDFRRIPAVRKADQWLASLSLRSRIAGTMLALVAIAGVVLAAWAVLADERLKRNVTYDLLSEELTHYEQRMRVDRGAEPLRSARLSISTASAHIQFSSSSRGIGVHPGGFPRARPPPALNRRWGEQFRIAYDVGAALRWRNRGQADVAAFRLPVAP